MNAITKKNSLPSGIKCCVKKCKKSKRHFKGLRMFKFPSPDMILGQIWREKCRIPEKDFNKNLYICENHFSSSYFGEKKLKLDVIPTLDMDEMEEEWKDFNAEVSKQMSREMDTKVEKIQDYVDYTKCGEIFKPPSGDNHRPYILKCLHCKENHLLLEAFVLHFANNCKIFPEENGSNNGYISENNDVPSIPEHLELVEKNAVYVKVEENISTQTDDPLIEVKSETFSDNDEPIPTKQDLDAIDSKVISVVNNDNEKHFFSVEDLCESDSCENLDNSDEDYHQSSENDDLSSDEDELKTIMEPKTDLDSTLKSSNFIKNFFETKEHVIAFIEAYKRQTSLWNKNYPYLKTKIERQSSLEVIADELNQQHGFSITWNEVKKIIVYLCRKYRKDLKYSKEMKESGENYTPSWFFEQLNFLKPFMEKNQITQLDSNMSDLLPNQIIEILAIYEELPHLWNTELIEYYCKNKIEAAKQEMLQKLETKLNIKITENILAKYIRTINTCFARKALNKKIDKSNSEDHALDGYYKYMLFLREHVGRFECSECKKSFKNPLYLKIHKNNVHGLEPFPCSQCKKPFKSVTAYTNHAKRHMEDLNYECKECGKKFLYSQELKIHMRKHNEIKPYCCEMCGSSFRHIQTFKTHQRRHLKNYLHHCELCGKGYYTKDSYKNHMNSHSNTRNQICSVCGKAFVTKHSLRQHIVIHDEVKRFPCKLCGKTFKQKTGVNQHMRTHNIASNEEKVTL